MPVRLIQPSMQSFSSPKTKTCTIAICLRSYVCRSRTGPPHPVSTAAFQPARACSDTPSACPNHMDTCISWLKTYGFSITAQRLPRSAVRERKRPVSIYQSVGPQSALLNVIPYKRRCLRTRQYSIIGPTTPAGGNCHPRQNVYQASCRRDASASALACLSSTPESPNPACQCRSDKNALISSSEGR